MGLLQGRFASGFATALVAACLLLGCGSAEDSSARAGSGGDGDSYDQIYDPNVSGGQTGSLIPQCGLAPAAQMEGIPASAEGFVLHTGECAGAFALDGLSLQDAQGRNVAFDVHALMGGAVLITPMGALPPGSYRVGHEAAPPAEDDAGLDDGGDDAGEAMEELAPEDTLNVTPVMADAAPQALGVLERRGRACNNAFTLALDPAAAQSLSLLSIDLQIDDWPPQPYFDYGTLTAEGGVTTLSLPSAVWHSLEASTHTLTLIAHVAGQDVELRTNAAPFEVVHCIEPGQTIIDYGPAREPEPDACTAVLAPHGRDAHAALAWFAGAFAWLLLRTRKCRTRGASKDAS